MQKVTVRKKEGFKGQKAIVIPRWIILNQCSKSPVIHGLYITDIGYYPKAKFHYRKRQHGAEQNIFIYCVEGKGEATIKGEKYYIGPGDYLVVPIKTAHKYAADESNPWTIYWLHFKGTNSASIIDFINTQNNGPKGFVPVNDKSLSLFNEIYHELERGYSSGHLIYANMCLWHFLAAFASTNKYDEGGKLDSKDTTNIAIDLLSTSLDKVITIKEIASTVNLSPSHFSYIFKTKTGYAPIEYFNHLKIQKACQYLLFTNLRIKEIALKLGIEDQYYFSRLFTKIMGTSPVEYREKRIH